MESFDPKQFMKEKHTIGWEVELEGGRKVMALLCPNTVIIEVQREACELDSDIPPFEQESTRIPFLHNGKVCHALRLSMEAAEALYSVLGSVLGKQSLVYASNWEITAGTEPSTVNIELNPQTPVCCRKCFAKEPPQFPPRAVFIVCPTCGNKRCPKATDHELACTNSNAPGQAGSAYE